jgi:hypothetical protein
MTPEKEAYPPATKWGIDGWTFYHLRDAEAHLAALAAVDHVADKEV